MQHPFDVSHGLRDVLSEASDAAVLELLGILVGDILRPRAAMENFLPTDFECFHFDVDRSEQDVPAHVERWRSSVWLNPRYYPEMCGQGRRLAPPAAPQPRAFTSVRAASQ